MQIIIQKPYTRYEIYELFEKQFTKNELARALIIDEKKEKVYELYECNDFTNFYNEEEKMESLEADLKLLHSHISWKMLSLQKLKLSK